MIMQNRIFNSTIKRLTATTALAAFASVFGCQSPPDAAPVQPANPPKASSVPSDPAVVPPKAITSLDTATVPEPCRRDNGKYGYCASSSSSTLVIPAVYDAAQHFTPENLAAVKINDRWGYIDRTGAFAIPAQFDQASFFSDGVAPVKSGGKYKFIDRTGKTAIRARYDDADPFSDGLAAVGINGKYGYINRTGRVVIPLRYTEAYDFVGGLADVATNRKYGFIDKAGKEIVPPKYDNRIYAYKFTLHGAELLGVHLNGKYGFINRRGEETLPLVYQWAADSFVDGLAPVQRDYRIGYIDRTGKTVIEFKYDEARPFSEGYARVTLNGEKIAVDKTGKEYNIRYNHHRDTYVPRD